MERLVKRGKKEKEKNKEEKHSFQSGRDHGNVTNLNEGDVIILDSL